MALVWNESATFGWRHQPMMTTRWLGGWYLFMTYWVSDYGSFKWNFYPIVLTNFGELQGVPYKLNELLTTLTN